MPALSNIAVNDRESTPVTHTFVPRGSKGDGVQLFVNSSGVPIGDEKLTVSLRESGARTRVRIVLTDPVTVTETINGVDRVQVERVSIANLQLTFDERSTLQERKNLVGMLANALASGATLDPVLTQLQDFY